MTAISLLAGLWVATHELLLVAAILILVFSFDELVVDAIYIFGRARRSLRNRLQPFRWTVADLPPGSDKRFAIFVPTWDEGEVIAEMLAHMTETFAYPAYDIFVGVYPNDPATRRAAESVRDARIRVVELSHPGPTTKADCLNALWAAMLAAEGAEGERYAAVVLHDAEDAVHPAELSVFAHVIGRKAMVQLPVVPVVDDDSRWISGHYCDEFAESHGKAMVVREALGAALPSAGVACVFERGAMQQVAEARGGTPFDARALTEDYELGIHVSRIGGGAFVRLPVRRGRDAVATREHFPADVESALQQKTRWLIGIAFQGWSNLGWRGSIADRYMFLRDRRAVPNAFVILLGYLALLMTGLCWAARLWFPGASDLPPVVAPDSFLATLLLVTTAMLLWRLFVRALFTASVYGPWQGLLSVPRAVVANAIGMTAAWRAFWRWVGHMLTGRPLVWQKTAHRFPDEAARCAPSSA